MTTAINTTNNSASALTYWNMLKDASDNVKLELITLISTSLIRRTVQRSAADFYGTMPESSDYPTDEWLEDIREGRKCENREMDLFA